MAISPPSSDLSGKTMDTNTHTSSRLGTTATTTLVPIVYATIAIPVADSGRSSTELRRIEYAVPLTSAIADATVSASLGVKSDMVVSPKRYSTGVGCFPPELIGEILSWYCSSPAQLPSLEITSDAFTFGRVCRMWRGIAIFRQDVWSSLRFNWAQSTSTLVAQESAISMAHVLTRSRNRPLHLQLSISAPRADVNSEALRLILAPIFSQASRWQNFSLTCSSEALEVINFVDDHFGIELPTPLLEGLTIQAAPKLRRMAAETQWPNTPLMNRFSAPLLRRVTFLDDAMMFIQTGALPWDQLYELNLLGLSVSVSFDEYAEILKNAGQMRKLSIAFDRGLESDEPIVLDNLEILHIIEHGIPPSVPQFHALMCEKLVQLSVEYVGDRAFNDDAEDTLGDMLAVINRLQRLSLHNAPLDEGGLMRTLGHCPFLTHLAISNNESSGFSLPLTNRALLQLTISRNRTPLPNLAHVSFASSANPVFSHN